MLFELELQFCDNIRELLGHGLLWIRFILKDFYLPFQDGGRYHIETSPLICGENQWTGFYMITASVLKGLRTCYFGDTWSVIPFMHNVKKWSSIILWKSCRSQNVKTYQIIKLVKFQRFLVLRHVTLKASAYTFHHNLTK